MPHDEPAPDSSEELRRLGEHVRDLTSELPGHEDDVADIVGPSAPGAPAPDPRASDRPASDVAAQDDEPVVDPEAAEEAADAEDYLAGLAPSTPLDALPEDLEPDVPGLFDVDDVEDDRPPRRHHVTAVLVAHDGERWLPAVLTALGRLGRRPDRLVAVDTGSIDATPDLLAGAVADGLVQKVVTADRHLGFGAAVGVGVEASTGVTSVLAADELHVRSDEPEVRWLWLLHDDSAPDPRALEALLRTADRHRSAEILGPKVRGWANRTHLLEVGVTVARSGDRVTGLERRELDQGQHDGQLDVLAVGSAGMLVRRDVWDDLGGFDPALPFFREDVDLCWRARLSGRRVVVSTDAVVHHREAATHRRREVDAGSPRHPERADRIDRVSAVHLMRAHAHGVRGPLVTLRMLVGSLLRAVGLLLGKAPDEARDEWGAFRDSVRDRSGLAASRASVHAAASVPAAVPDRDVRAMLAPRGSQLRHGFERLRDIVAGREAADAQRSVLDSTTDDPEGWYADDKRPSRVRRMIARPGALALLGLLVVALIGERALFGEGVLLGGALVPAPEGAGDLWQTYWSGWHEVGVGSAADAPAWLLPMTLLAGVLRGSAPLAVDVVLLLAVPLSGLTAWLAMRGLRLSTPARVWVAVTYATLPAVTGALSGGRIGSAAALVLLPWLARSSARLVGIGAGAPVTWRRSFGTGLLLAVVASFVPVVWLMAAVLGIVAGLTIARDRGGRVRLAAAVLLPVALLVPWSLRVVREPGLLWLEPGLVGPGDRSLSAVDVLLLRPGGPGMTPLWLGAGIVLAGIACLGVPGRRRSALAAWAVGLVGLAFGVLMTVLRVSVPSLEGSVAPWPGVATAVWAAGLMMAIALTVDALPAQLAGRDFGWRQPTVVVLVVMLLVAPLGAAGLLLLGADGPLRRSERDVLPAFVAAGMRGDERPRSLVLRRLGAETVVFDLMSTPEPQLGDPDVAPSQETSAEIDRLVARLVAGIGATEVDELADHGVRYVVLADARADGDPLVESLDSQRGLRRLATREGDTLWELVPVSARSLTLATTVDSGVPLRTATVVPTTGGDPRTPTEVATSVAAGAPGRELLLAEAVDDRWRWTVDGEAVSAAPRTTAQLVDPSLQAAPLGAPAADVAIAFDRTSRAAWLWVQGALLLVAVVLALPSRRRDDDDEGEELDVEGVPS